MASCTLRDERGVPLRPPWARRISTSCCACFGDIFATWTPPTCGTSHASMIFEYCASVAGRSNLASEVNKAEARIEADGGSMAGLSTQQLEALAAARFSG